MFPFLGLLATSCSGYGSTVSSPTACDLGPSHSLFFF